jgi:thiol-disulfide isomerase/thioredoxin
MAAPAIDGRQGGPMTARKCLSLLLLMLLLAPGAGAAGTVETSDLVRQAEAKLDAGGRLAGEGKLAEAAAVYLQAAEIYEQVLQKDANDRSSRQNYAYALGERGMIYVRRGQQALSARNHAQAADAYGAAIAAYDLALKKLPQERNFQGNRRHCRHEWGLAQFQAKLAAKGPAFPFQLAGLDGSPLALAGMKGRVVVLEFAAGWCPECRASLPVLEELQKRFKDRARVAVLALDRVEGWSKGGSEEKMLALAKGAAYAAAWADEEAFYQYGSFGSIPTVFLIDKAGKLVAQVPADGRGLEDLARRVAALL